MNHIQFQVSGKFLDSESRDLPTAKVKNLSELKRSLRTTRQYDVVLLDDNDHTYEYVIEMLMEIFGHSRARAFEMACTVDLRGRVVVFTSTKKAAEEKRIQIISYGPDWRLARSNGSMKAMIEPVE
jgi:ATP-dependent Clp protease adaptor protein ClpS